MRFDDQRKLMIENTIIKRGITDLKLINAIMSVPREEFVMDEWKNFAYKDHPLQIGHQQTISQPYIIAYMLNLLDIQEHESVLEIGTGSGYQTAILAELAKEVFTVERIEPLSMNARRVLKSLNYSNIHFRIGDGTKGWEKAIPNIQSFDKIVVSASSPKIPQSLINQLNEGGRLAIPIGQNYDQYVVLVEKINGNITEEKFSGCSFVPLIGEEGWDN